MKKFGHKLLGIALLCSLLPNYTDAQTAAESSNIINRNWQIAAYIDITWSVEKNFKIAQKNFETTTGYALNIESYSSKPNMIATWLNQNLSDDPEITVIVFWKQQGNRYAIDSTIVMTDKAQELFTDEALKAFKDTIQSYREVVTTTEEIKVDEKIIAALETLLEDIKDVDPKRVQFLMTESLTKKRPRFPHFDDNDEKHCSAYPTYKENEPYIYVGDLGRRVCVHVIPRSQAKKVELTEDVILEVDASKQPKPPMCTIYPTANTTMIAYKKGDDSHKPLGKINIIDVSASGIEIEITICKVKYKTEAAYTTIKKDAIADNVKKIYGVANQEFVLLERQIEIESPDKNANGILDIAEQEILEAFLRPHVVGYTMFIINQGIAGEGTLREQEAAGYAYENTIYPKIPKRSFMVISKKASIETCAHEIGHAVFGFKHPFEQFKNHPQGKDRHNIMDYEKIEGKTQLRAYQVKHIIDPQNNQ